MRARCARFDYEVFVYKKKNTKLQEAQAQRITSHSLWSSCWSTWANLSGVFLRWWLAMSNHLSQGKYQRRIDGKYREQTVVSRCMLTAQPLDPVSSKIPWNRVCEGGWKGGKSQWFWDPIAMVKTWVVFPCWGMVIDKLWFFVCTHYKDFQDWMDDHKPYNYHALTMAHIKCSNMFRHELIPAS